MKINAHNRLRNPVFADNIKEHTGTILNLLSKELKLPLTQAKPRGQDVFELPLSSRDFGVFHLTFIKAIVTVSLHEITRENAILAKVELDWVNRADYKSTTPYGSNGRDIGRFAYFLETGEFKLI